MAFPAPEPPSCRRALALFVANLAVANAISLLAGLGGLRTPSTGANLLLAALLVSLPWIAMLRRAVAPLTPLTSPWERVQQQLFVIVACLSGLLMLAFGAWTVGLLLLWFLVGLAAVLPLTLPPPLDLPLGPLAVAGALALAAASPWRRPDRAWLRWPWRLLRLLAFALPWGWLGLVAFAGIWTPGAFVGRDPMHEPFATLPAAWGRVEAVRVNAAAFTDYVVRVDRVLELGPALEWRWRLLTRGDCGNATLARDGGTLVVRFVTDDAAAEADAHGRPAVVRLPLDDS